MNLKQAYTKVMVESIKNSGMWLEEAKLVAKKGSKSHAQALTIFAGEELGKALMCWMTINGVFPFNHWEADFRHKKSVFHRHDLKNATVIGFSFALLTPADIPEEPDGVRELLAKMGAFATWARSAWMYVDIKKKDDQLEVSSPLSTSPYSVEDALKDMEYTLRIFKKLARASREHPETFEKIFQELRKMLEEKDKKFPKKPQWE